MSKTRRCGVQAVWGTLGWTRACKGGSCGWLWTGSKAGLARAQSFGSCVGGGALLHLALPALGSFRSVPLDSPRPLFLAGLLCGRVCAFVACSRSCSEGPDTPLVSWHATCSGYPCAAGRTYGSLPAQRCAGAALGQQVRSYTLMQHELRVTCQTETDFTLGSNHVSKLVSRPCLCSHVRVCRLHDLWPPSFNYIPLGHVLAVARVLGATF